VRHPSPLRTSLGTLGAPARGRVLAATTLALAALAVAGCGSGGNSSAAKTEANGYPASNSATTSATAPAASGSTTGATVVSTEHTTLGTVLAAGPKRLTVYLFAADTGPHSTCTGACAQVWPPVTSTAAPQAEGGAVAANLGTIERAGGVKQLTYKGHPLYYYVSDQQAGETTGQGLASFGAPWYVLAPSGNEITGS
jgi:predicted lipoprotein with Yx(FWY)xxD motif